MHERLKSEKAKRMKVQRSSTVEPVLGSLLNFTGMRRIWTRGIKNANKFVLGAAIAYNLKKWLNWENKGLRRRGKTLLNSKKKAITNALDRFLNDEPTFSLFE